MQKIGKVVQEIAGEVTAGEVIEKDPFPTNSQKQYLISYYQSIFLYKLD